MENIGMPQIGCTHQQASFVPTPSSAPSQSISETKKRKTTETSSQVWDHFEKILNNEGLLVEGKCRYCGKTFAPKVKEHGISSLKVHMLSCLKNPHSKQTRQSMLAFQASESEDSESVLTTCVFNQESVRKALAEMTISDELPFKFVEKRGFKQFVDLACPMFKIPFRWTVNRDIFGIFLEEKTNLKKVFNENRQRISLTANTWTSVQRINYMCITAHYIDAQWKLNKKIISFVPIYSHKGETIAKAIECCLVDWGIKKITTITVDNASSNDVAIGFLKSKLVSWGSSSVRAQYLHMRCIVHILNLVVQDELKMADSLLKKLRECVRWVRGSPSRLQKFRELADLLGVEDKNSLCLDVPTRWNSTYMMIQTAIAYKDVFESYAGNDDVSFKSDLGDSVLTYLDWLSFESLVILLKTFYEMAVRISGSLYVTSNSYLTEISDLSCIIADMMQSSTKTEKTMGTKMKERFDRYWGDPEKMNFIIFFANILDPRDKVEYMPAQLDQLYGEDQGKECFNKVRSKLTSLFEDYAAEHSTSGSEPSNVISCPPNKCENALPYQSKFKIQFKRQMMERALLEHGSELGVYLSEPIVNDRDDFDVLRWWEANSERFPILSKVARDILAVPISTVTSESAFSTSGKVLDNFRSSLTPKTVEALLCTQDWLRCSISPEPTC